MAVLVAVFVAGCNSASTKGKWVMANQAIGSAADAPPEIIWPMPRPKSSPAWNWNC